MQKHPDKQASGNRGSAHKEDETDKKDPTQGIPDWLQPFTGNLEDLETHVPAHSSEREISDSEGDASKLGTPKRKHNIFSLHQRPKLRRMLENQNYEDSLQHKSLVTFDNSGSQSP